jgi:tetratricopeptide (TPR) repeat protein
LLVAAAGLVAAGCQREAPRRSQSLRFRGDNSDVYLRSVAATLNNLPEALDLELLPAQPILTAATSTNGKEVRAICMPNPRQPDGPINYFRLVDDNADLVELGVRFGDKLRYYVNLDPDAAERNIEQRTALELTIRRLDAENPQTALIIDGALVPPTSDPAELQEWLQTLALDPQRIEIWRISDKRMENIQSRLNLYVEKRRPPAGWEPSPDLSALEQIVDRANQWLRNQPEADAKAAGAWRLDPLLAGLPAALREATGVADAITEQPLRDGVFASWEGRLLEQAVWCRDISQWARGQTLSDLEAVAALFDWTVRNIQLDEPDAVTPILHPWQALAYGHGSVELRAWAFIELCRQQGVDAVILQPAAGADGTPAPLLAAALVDEKLYLFDPQLGLPVPGEAAAIATLDEAAENPELLRRLDLSDDEKYALTSVQLAKVDAFVAASHVQLARRSLRLEAALEGEEFVRLSAGAQDLADKLAKHGRVGEVKLWPRPFEAVADEFSLKQSRRVAARQEFQPFAERPLLWKARVMHFQGDKDVRASERGDPLAQARLGHQDALALYQDPTVRPSDDKLEKLAEDKQRVYKAAKSASSCWVGLLSYDRQKYDVAAAWLERLLDREPRGKWAQGARYNLARTHEALGQTDEAIKLLRAGPEDAPQRYGNLVRAKQLAAGEK